MDDHKLFRMPFATVYPLYVKKVERKGRTQADVDEVIRWLTGYSQEALVAQIDTGKDFESFFAEAPLLHPHADRITGLICGVRIEEIQNPLMRKIRCLDKLVDELAKGRPMTTIQRS